jgi:hypothetical protein
MSPATPTAAFRETCTANGATLIQQPTAPALAVRRAPANQLGSTSINLVGNVNAMAAFPLEGSEQ